jgi:hypothetical protein
MMSLTVHNEMRVYEIDGDDCDFTKNHHIGVNSHWNRNEFVVLVIGSKRYTVVGNDLVAAVRNAQRTK